MTTLDAEFEKSNGRKHHLRLKDVDTSKTGDQIRASLEKMTKLSLFEKNGVGLFKKVKHAKFINKIETPIYDRADEINEQNSVEPIAPVQENIISQIEEPAEIPTDIEKVQIPEDLSIEEERPEPGLLIQRIKFPKSINPLELNESQALDVIAACMSDRYTLANIQIDDRESPVTLILTEKLKSGEPEIPEITASSPRNKRKRLINRIRKRE